MKNDMIFSQAELKEMGKNTAGVLEEAITAGDTERALRLTRRMLKEFLSIHHLYREWATSLLTFIGKNYGEEVLTKAFEEACAIGWGSVIKAYKEGSPKRRAEMMAGALRSHHQDFEMIEDDEKITFIVRNCGSGGQQIRSGAYEPPMNLLRIKTAQPMTQGNSNFPVYCAHAHFVHALFIRLAGAPYFIEAASKNVGYEPCKIYVYKDPENIPYEVYERVGLKDLYRQGKG